MNKRELDKFRTLIEAELERVRGTLGRIESEINDRTAGAASGNQAYSNHMADVGSDAIEQEQAFLHASQEVDYLQGLEEALLRVNDGTYGTCEECSAKIPMKRLEAFLAALLCIDCKSRLERLPRS